ncbi:protein phosphatase 1 regulatory subunit 42 [Terrabacter sp. Ter38]|uniref:protein phosphatase 1 regulatory subunit 42 n=1 Tax=Terrabacter sp. Ter38 TaxID=2926030 RepID=UPI002118F3A8|nr:protein phosphatase 1 regulatory subunit 42 [Terrabacter sp. Ter38]
MTTDVDRALAELVEAGAVAAGTTPGEVVDLIVSHARSLDGLERFTGLETLSLIACDVGDYSVLSLLSGLHVLAVENSDLADVSPVAGLPLQVLSLRRNRIRDASAIIALDGLQVLDLTGNPLDPPSRSAAGALEGVLVTLDDPALADVNVDLADAGVPLVGYRVGDEVWGCSTGLGLTAHPEAGHVVTSLEDLEAVARGDRDAGDLLGVRTDDAQEDT